MSQKHTDDLQSELEQAASLDEFLQENDSAFRTGDFASLIDEALQAKNMTKAVLAKQAGMSEVYLHQLFSGRRNPSRTKVICICIGLTATLEETQQILRQSGMAQLYAKAKRDAIIMYGIAHHKDLYEINDMLFENDENTLF